MSKNSPLKPEVAKAIDESRGVEVHPRRRAAPNDLDTARCGVCGEAVWFDATDTGWTHDDPDRNTHPVTVKDGS